MKFILLLFALPVICFGQTTISWEPALPVSESSFSNMHPRIVLDRNNNPLVLWGNMMEAAAYFSRWTGTGFSEPVRVTPVDMAIFAASWAGPDIAAFGDTIYVVFKENPEVTAPAFCVHSYNGGSTFSDPVQVDIMLGDNVSRFPSVTVNEEGQPIVAFMRLDSDFGNARYVVATSDDFGNSFNMDVLASGFSGGDVCDCCPVGVIAENNYVATLYRDNLDDLRNSWAGISTTGGDMFMNGIQIDQTDWTINSCPSTGPDGVIINDSLYAVFMSAAGGIERVYFSSSSLISYTANMSKRITNEFPDLTSQKYPRIANYGNAVAIAWRQNVATDSEIPLLFTADITNGLPLAYDTVALLDFYGLENTDVAVSSTTVHVIWQDNYNDVVMYRSGSYTQPVLVSDITDDKTISLYPNPASDQINIELNNFTDGNIDLVLFDISGNPILKKKYSYSPTIKVDISNLAGGIYLVEIIDGNGKGSKRIFCVMK
ncbi:MAG: T9SS type A sorting domain-containing protein [Chitinophagales bacterium]